MAENKQFDHEYKVQISQTCERNWISIISQNTLYSYMRANRLGNLGLGTDSQFPGNAMMDIHAEDKYNDTYERIRMYQALILKQPKNVNIPSERTFYRIMEEIGLNHPPRRKPNGIIMADREARKSQYLVKRNFKASKPLTKCVTDRTEIKSSDKKLQFDEASILARFIAMQFINMAFSKVRTGLVKDATITPAVTEYGAERNLIYCMAAMIPKR